MSLTWEQFQENLKAGKVEATSQGSASGYQDAVFTVEEAKFIPHSKLPEGMQAKMDVDGVYWMFDGVFEFKDGKKKQHVFYSPALTKKGAVACYPSNDEVGIVGTLLHDIVHGIKQLDEKALPENWLDNVAEIHKVLKGKKSAMRAKLIKDGEYLIAETSYQKKRDVEYVLALPAAEVFQNTQSSDNFINPDDLPF